MAERYPFSVARREFSSLYDRVEQGAMAIVRRRGSKPIAIVDAAEQTRLLARSFPFSVQVRVGRDYVALWVDDLPVHAHADNLEAATDELVQELIQYAEDWEEQLRFAPNHGDAWGFVRRIQLAGNAEAIREMLIGRDGAHHQGFPRPQADRGPGSLQAHPQDSTADNR